MSDLSKPLKSLLWRLFDLGAMYKDDLIHDRSGSAIIRENEAKKIIEELIDFYGG